jgi:hypothetical protein
MVLIEALKVKKLKVNEHIVVTSSQYKQKLTEALNIESKIGIIVNETSTSWLMKHISGSHWYSLSLRKHQGNFKWFNCDSKLRRPVLLPGINTTSDEGSLKSVLQYIDERRELVSVQLFVVCRDDEQEESSN